MKKTTLSVLSVSALAMAVIPTSGTGQHYFQQFHDNGNSNCQHVINQFNFV